MARQRDLAGHQQRLSAATWAVLADQGVAALTIRAVAERAGCSTGLVLHTFADKRALLGHARALLHERTAARADSAEAASTSPYDALYSVLLQAASLNNDKREEARVWIGFLAAALADPDLAAKHRSHNRSFIRRIERLVAACRPEWTADECVQQAKSLIALVEGLNTLAAVDPRTYTAVTQRAAIDEALSSVREAE
jgi:TetR/AcrR family transcriptional repressor of bet genes